MKKYFYLFILIMSQTVLASPCEVKVTAHYKHVYHDTYKAASNTFLNNFIGRKNARAHTLGYPEKAFLGYSWNPNYIAENIIEKSNRTEQEVYDMYMSLLQTEQLCEDLGEDYKKFRKVRHYLLEKLKLR